MATTMTLSQIINAASELSREQQLALNKALVEMIRSERRVTLALAGAQFKIGQIVRFNAKTRGIKTMQIEKFNRAGTAVVGFELREDGSKSITRWTVATTLCTAVAA